MLEKIKACIVIFFPSKLSSPKIKGKYSIIEGGGCSREQKREKTDFVLNRRGAVPRGAVLNDFNGKWFQGYTLWFQDIWLLLWLLGFQVFPMLLRDSIPGLNLPLYYFSEFQECREFLVFEGFQMFQRYTLVEGFKILGILDSFLCFKCFEGIECFEGFNAFVGF